MISPKNFSLRMNVLKWTWLRHNQTGNLKIDFLNWENPEGEPVKTLLISDTDHRSYYMRSGFVPPTPLRLPVVIRVSEQASGDDPCSFVHTLSNKERCPIYWHINKTTASGLWEFSVHYPSFTDVSPGVYPEKALYFLVRAPGETEEQGARFYLPQPTVPQHTFWFAPENGYSIDLRMDASAPFRRNDVLTFGDVFTLQSL